jgi:hypothetical protein
MRELILFALVDAFVSTTVAEMKIAAPLRKIRPISDLLSCPWCAGFWIAFLLVALFRPTAGLAPGAAGFVLDWILVAFFSGVTSFIVKAIIKAAAA